MKRASRHQRAIRYVLIGVVVALALLVALSLQGYSSTTAEKPLTAGLINSAKPLVFFELTNTGSVPLNYTYVVVSNSTSPPTISVSTVSVLASHSFDYSDQLSRPHIGVIVVSLRIFLGSSTNGTQLYDQTWVIEPP